MLSYYVQQQQRKLKKVLFKGTRELYSNFFNNSQLIGLSPSAQNDYIFPTTREILSVENSNKINYFPLRLNRLSIGCL